MMHHRLLGTTGLWVSELCLGTMTFGSAGLWAAMGGLGEAECERLVATALEAGVNFIDTANVYSIGESERLLGLALRKLARPRDGLVIATKVFGRMGDGLNESGLSRAHILHSVDESLRRLGLDHVDLLQIHGFDPFTPIEETMRALDAVVRSGKARYVGFCNLPAWYAMKANAYAASEGLSRFISAQVYYSIAGRDIEREIVPMTQSEQLAVLPWSPLAGGLLSGKFDLDQPGPEGARRTTFDFPPVDRDRARPILAVLREVAAAHGTSVARVALAWMLTKPFVTSIIIGARTVEQLRDNLEATSLELTKEEVTRLDEVSALPQEYPGWMLARQNNGRRPATAR